MSLSFSLPQTRLWIFAPAVGVVYGTAVALVEFSDVPVSGLYSLAVTGSQWLTVAVCAMALMAFLTVSRLLFAALATPLITATAVMCWFNRSIGVRLTAVTIEIIAANAGDSSMAMSLVTPGLVVVTLLSLAAGILLAVWRWKYVCAGRSETLAVGLISLAVVCCPLFLVRRIAPAVGGRLPYAMYFATKEYLTNRKNISRSRHTYDSTAARAAKTPPDVIVIIGESLRADHLPFNGYGRNTMPHLSADTALISFSAVYSGPTHTSASLPVIMTRADDRRPDAAYEDQSFVTLFRRAGYRTVWIANQDLSASYTYFAHECDSLIYCNADRSMYSYDKWLDADTEPLLKEWLEKKGDRPGLAVVHTIGSHWWYKSHYTDRQALFLPDIDHKDTGGLSRRQMINAYDNTIVATDEFLAAVFSMVAGRNAVVLFISDHGEALGEDGIFLHAGDVEPLHYPACMVWTTPAYRAAFPATVGALQSNREKKYETDAIFHTVLDLAGISTPAKDIRKSLTYHE